MADESLIAIVDDDESVRGAATNLFRSMGFPAVELIETRGHPLVYAESLGAPGLPTVLIYGHYDVQPPEPLEPWNSPPFEPTVVDGSGTMVSSSGS